MCLTFYYKKKKTNSDCALVANISISQSNEDLMPL